MRAARAVAAAVLAVGVAVVVPAGVASAASSMNLSVACASHGTTATACTAEPTELTATVSIVDTVSVTFDTTGRPDAAPEPEDNPVVLRIADAHCSASGLFARRCTWSIPAGLYSKASTSELLDGTYTVTACGGSPCGADPTYAPATFSLSVPPAAPPGVRAAASGGVVTVSWSAASAPDLAGYAVYRAAGTSRDYSLLWDCADDGAPLAGAAACGSLSTTDSPGPGSWSYAVVALRYGSSPTGADPVASPAATVAIAVKASPTTGTTTTTTTSVPGGSTKTGGSTTTTTLGGSGARKPASGSTGTGTASTATLSLPPVQVATAPPTVTPASPPPDPPQLSAPSTIPPAFSETIPYKHTSSEAAAAAGQDLGRGAGTSVTGIGLIAGALLALAAAAHLWFARQESRRVGAHSRR